MGMKRGFYSFLWHQLIQLHWFPLAMNWPSNQSRSIIFPLAVENKSFWDVLSKTNVLDSLDSSLDYYISVIRFLDSREYRTEIVPRNKMLAFSTFPNSFLDSLHFSRAVNEFDTETDRVWISWRDITERPPRQTDCHIIERFWMAPNCIFEGTVYSTGQLLWHCWSHGLVIHTISYRENTCWHDIWFIIRHTVLRYKMISLCQLFQLRFAWKLWKL